MPKSVESQTEQIRKLKDMLARNESIAKEMRKLLDELETKTRESKEKKRGQ
jgi:hypothetical protein